MLVKIKTEIRDDLRSTERGQVVASAGRGHGSSTAYAGPVLRQRRGRDANLTPAQ